METQQSKLVPSATNSALICLIAVALYFAGYLALADHGQTALSFGGRYPRYRMGGKWARTFFYPAEKIDRKWRGGWDPYTD